MSRYVSSRTVVNAATKFARRGGGGNGADAAVAGRPYVNGFLFNEKPLKAGEQRKREFWEHIYWGGMTVGGILFFVGNAYRPDKSLDQLAFEEVNRLDKDYKMNARTPDGPIWRFWS